MSIPFRPAVALGEQVAPLAEEAIAAGSKFTRELIDLPPWHRPLAAKLSGKEFPTAVENGAGAFSVMDSSGYAAVEPMMKLIPLNMPVLRASARVTEPRFTFTTEGLGEIVFPKGMAAAERADAIAAGGYANMIHFDAIALRTASRIERDAIGFVSRKIEVDAMPEQVQQFALDGALRYTKGLPGNKYTEFLQDRFGEYGAKRQWLRSIFSA